jgi:DNA-binding HxlR family transcriptional regulator
MGVGGSPGTLAARPDAARLAALYHHRGAGAVLAVLPASGGAKVVTLAKRLGAPTDSLRRTLEALAARGLARPNPGYGHPMRPEWVVAPEGARLAPRCAVLARPAERAGLAAASRRKWALPIRVVLLDGPVRFTELAAALPGVTARALAQTLRVLEEAGAVRRRVVADHPPRALYSATVARPVAAALRRLAREGDPRCPKP